jgi:formylglycine-generating enzyme required for sulfatase activity
MATFDKILGEVLSHKHKAKDLIGVQKANIIDTKDNILALTPTAGLIAYATDANVKRTYIADGSDWIEDFVKNKVELKNEAEIPRFSIEPTTDNTTNIFVPTPNPTNLFSSLETSFFVPENWILVPGDSLYGTQDFLAMKYEAKAWNTSTNEVVTDGGFSIGNSWAGGTGQTTYRAKSTPDGRPWVRIAQSDANYDAIQACQDAWQQAGLPSGSTHLITNNEWMTIARNAEAQNSNWTNNEVGNGALFRGNSNSAASLDGSDPLTGINTRTLNLSNGAVIWDLAGNVWQWTDNTILGQNKPESGNASAYVEWTAISDFGTLSYNLTRPLGSTYNSVQGVGQYYMGPRTNNTEYAFLRGGGWTNSTAAGAFTLNLNGVPANQGTTIGFRCTSDPVAISTEQTVDGIKITSGSINSYYTQTLTLSDQIEYTLYFDIKLEAGGVVDSDIAVLYANGAEISTTYNPLGGDWYRLSASFSGDNTSKKHGLLIKPNKTIVISDASLLPGRGDDSILVLRNPNSGYFQAIIEGSLETKSQDMDRTTVVNQAVASQTSNLAEWQNSSGTALSKIEVDGTADMSGYKVGGVSGAGGTFTTADSKTVTVVNGIITDIT